MKGYRFMRLVVLFDLPTLTSNDRKEYRKFRKFLISNGFVMMQESVYMKLALNYSIMNRVKENIKKNKPLKGLVQVLVITEKQFSKMETLIGETQDIIVNTDERMLIL